MKKLAFIICVLFAFPGFSQKFMSAKDFEALKNKTLIVVIEEPREKLSSKLTPEEAAKYTSDIELYNQSVKELGEQYLGAIVKVAFKTRTETDALIKKADRNFAYLQFSSVGQAYTNKLGFKMIAKHQDSRKTRNLGDVVTRTGFFSGFEIYFAEDGDMANARHQQFCFEPGVSKAVLTYGIRSLAAALADIGQGKSQKDRDLESIRQSTQLASKKLLISQFDLDPKVTPEQLKTLYPYPVEVVEETRFQNAIANKEPGTAVVIVLPAMTLSEKFVFKFEVYDTETGKILAPSIPGGSKTWSLSIGVESSMVETIKKNLNEKIPYVELVNFEDFARYAKGGN